MTLICFDGILAILLPFLLIVLDNDWRIWNFRRYTWLHRLYSFYKSAYNGWFLNCPEKTEWHTQHFFGPAWHLPNKWSPKKNHRDSYGATLALQLATNDFVQLGWIHFLDTIDGGTYATPKLRNVIVTTLASIMCKRLTLPWFVHPSNGQSLAGPTNKMNRSFCKANLCSTVGCWLTTHLPWMIGNMKLLFAPTVVWTERVMVVAFHHIPTIISPFPSIVW